MRSALVVALLVWATSVWAQPGAPTNVHVNAALVTVTPCTDAATAGTIIYVRQGAAGTASGADWTNAVTTVPSTLVRGQTYCVADTTTGFGALTITSHAVSTTYTKIVKATIADHGTATGWLDTMGDGQAVFSSSAADTFAYTASSGYLEINGNGTVTTCGARAALSGGTQGGCGFKFINTSDGGHTMQWNGNGTHAIVRYTEQQGPTGTTTTGTSQANESMCQAAWGGGFDTGLLQYNYIHNCVTQIDTLGDGSVIDGNYVANSRNNAGAAHSNVFFIGGGSNNITFKYNYATNYDDEGFFITWYTGGTPAGPTNLLVYGNVFYSPTGTNPRGIEIRQNDSGSSVTYASILLYNNVFGDLGVGGILDRTDEVDPANTDCAGCEARDNISVNAGNSFTVMVNNNNTDDATTARFVAYGTNFHLTGALAGVTLVAPFTTDLLGNARGADGTWDRGAYEFCAGGCTVP